MHNDCDSHVQVSDQSCGANLPGSKCVPINRCPAVLDNRHAPIIQTSVCGFDEDSKLLMVCCPYLEVTDSQVKVKNYLLS